MAATASLRGVLNAERTEIQSPAGRSQPTEGPSDHRGLVLIGCDRTEAATPMIAITIGH
jgi:hypothetical protein